MRALAPVLLLLLAPTVSACSFAGPVPGPAAFTLVPMEGGEARTIVVDGRMSGGMCELSNPHLLVDGVFAWMEYQYPRSGSYREAHLLDLATGEKRVIRLASPDVDKFGLRDGKLVYQARDFSGALPPPSVFYVHDVETGDLETLPFPDGNWVSMATDGRYLAASRRENGYEGPDRIYLYDITTRSWVFENETAAQLTGDAFAWMVAVGDGWLVASARDAYVAYDIGTGARHWLNGTREAPVRVDRIGAVVDGWAYTWNVYDGAAGRTRIERYLLPNGPRETLDAPPNATVVGIVPGYTVLGDYSAPHLNPLGRFWWLAEIAWWVWGGLALAVGLVAAVVWSRRR